MNNIALTADVNSKVNLVKSIANKTRGPYTPEKYGNVIIPMAIIRRFDCILADKNAEIDKILKAASKVKGMTPDKLEEMVKRSCGVPFYNAKCVSLEQLVGDSDNLNSNFLEFIASYSPSIQRILQSLKFREEVEFMIKKGILFEIVKAFSEVDFHPSTTSPIAMGYIFEEIIRTYKANAEAGDHYTPREVIELCIDLMLSENVDSLKKEGKIIRIYDGCCGTGGMLTTAKRMLTDPEEGFNIRSENIRLYGQDNNPEAYAVCQAEMLMLGDDPTYIQEGNTLTEDRFPGEKFDLLITNPPFGVEWKTEKSTVEKELKQPNNRFVAGTPRVSDGQLLFLQNLLAKAEDDARIAIILNGSPLFSGDAGSGESEIRRYVLENHLLEAIVALPDQMFYNTGIYTYVWILSKKPNPRRNQKIQLIDATSCWIDQKPKSLGNKRKFIDEVNRRKIVEAYTDFAPSEVSKIFDADDFGYTKVTMERPLYDENGSKVIKRGKVQVDPKRRDTEIIPLKQDIDAYIKAEVLPYVPDAFPDRSKDKIGYVITFTRYFYKYKPPRSSEEVFTEILTTKEKALTKIDESTETRALKSSGIEWFGKIPQEWDLQRIKSNFSVVAGATPKSGEMNYWDGDIPWITPADYTTEDVYVSHGHKTITQEGMDSCATSLVPEGSIIFSKRAPVGLVAINTNPLCTNQGCLSCVPKEDVDTKYFYYVMSIYGEQFDLFASGTTFKEISAEAFASFKLPHPNYAEQGKIASYLDDKCAEIDALIAVKEQLIQKLKEYRQSLIYEAVTGKIEV